MFNVYAMIKQGVTFGSLFFYCEGTPMAKADEAGRRFKLRVHRRKLADGSIKEYRYDPVSREPINGEPGSREFQVSSVRGVMAREQKTATLDQVIADYKAGPRFGALKQRSKGLYLRAFDRMREILDGWGIDPATYPIDLITRAYLQRVHDVLRAKPGICNQWVTAMSAVFRHAVTFNYVTVNPMVGGHSWEVKMGHWRRWAADEFQQFLDGAEDRWKFAALLGLVTGQRCGDLCLLKWSQYDGAGFDVTQQKTAVRVYVPLQPFFLAILNAWHKDTNSDHVLHLLDGRPIRSNIFSTLFGVELKRIGLHGRGLTFHGLRKTMLALAAESGGTAKEMASLSGHQTLASLELYVRDAEARVLAHNMSSKMDQTLRAFIANQTGRALPAPAGA